MGAPAGSGTPRCGCGAGRVTAARPRAWTRRPRPTPRPLPPTGIHKLYERVVASYLKNAHLEEGDKRWTGLSLARCATQSTRSSTWPDSVRDQIAQWLQTDASKPNGADPGRLSRSRSNRPRGFKPSVGRIGGARAGATRSYARRSGGWRRAVGEDNPLRQERGLHAARPIGQARRRRA